MRWLTELYVDQLLVENVEEFVEWGPLGANGRPLKSRKGETFRTFVRTLEGLGYRVEWRVLNAADYGDPTTRRRLFIQARRSRGPIRWPVPTHSPDGQHTLAGPTERWRAAREVIDWSIEGRSIFGRKKPLKPRTIARILAGLERFGGEELRPFLVILRNNATAASIDGPIPTITAGGGHVGLCQPFVMPVTHGRDRGRIRGLDVPLPTVTGANRGEFALVQAFVLGQQSCAAPRSTEKPLPTIATAGAIRLVEPVLVPFYGSVGARRLDRTRSMRRSPRLRRARSSAWPSHSWRPTTPPGAASPR
jgi:DNA (cytosine-5)-methyltransferase 1